MRTGEEKFWIVMIQPVWNHSRRIERGTRWNLPASKLQRAGRTRLARAGLAVNGEPLLKSYTLHAARSGQRNREPDTRLAYPTKRPIGELHVYPGRRSAVGIRRTRRRRCTCRLAGGSRSVLPDPRQDADLLAARRSTRDRNALATAFACFSSEGRTLTIQSSRLC